MTWKIICDGLRRWTVNENLYYEIRGHASNCKLVRFDIIRKNDGGKTVNVSALGCGGLISLVNTAYKNYISRKERMNEMKNNKILVGDPTRGYTFVDREKYEIETAKPSIPSATDIAKKLLNNAFGNPVFKEVDLLEKCIRNRLEIKKVYFNDPVTVVLWKDGTKTIVRAGEYDTYDPEKGLAMAIAKKVLGNQGNYYEVFKKWLPEEKKDELDELDEQIEAMEGYIEDLKKEHAEEVADLYLPADKYAEKIGVTSATVRRNAAKGKYEGAKKVNGKWMIPLCKVI